MVKQVFQEKFQEIFNKGLLQGCTAIAGVVLEKATKGNESAEKRIEDIIKFCEISLKNGSGDKNPQ